MTGPGKTIILIDDSPLIIARLRRLLESVPGTGPIWDAGTYAEALPLLQAYTPDIAFVDIHLPQINGIEVLKRIRQDFPSTTVIMVSNEASDAYRDRCQTLGAAFFIDKSSELHLINEILSSLL